MSCRWGDSGIFCNPPTSRSEMGATEVAMGKRELGSTSVRSFLFSGRTVGEWFVRGDDQTREARK